MAYIPKSNTITHFPIGSIIVIHPSVDFTKVINDTNWRLCNGDTGLTVIYPDRTTYGGGTGNFDLPDLTDDRFLMGISGTTLESLGSNVMLDHKHSTTSNDLCLADVSYTSGSGSVCIDHSHGHNITLNSGTVSGSASGTNCGLHCHCVGYLTGCVGGTVSNRELMVNGSGAYTFACAAGAHCHTITGSVSTTYSGGVTTHTGTCSFTDVSGSLTSNCITGTIGEGTTDVHAGTIDNRPKYFTVRYYMRIK